MANLKAEPCVYCHRDPQQVASVTTHTAYGETTVYWVVCHCGACGPHSRSIEAALAAWNEVSKLV